MKLVVTIPAYNEEKAIGEVIKKIKNLSSKDFDSKIDEIKIVVINDGSSDNTVEVAKKAGADRIVSFKKNMKVAKVYREGLEAALEMGADVIVNIDADGQHDVKDIPKLVEPILSGKADMIIGSRFKKYNKDITLQRRIVNKIATFVTKTACGNPITDAQSGFRALSREAALRMNIMAKYTYVQESIIQAANQRLVVDEVPIIVKKRNDGKSRLISNIFSYAKKAGFTIFWTFVGYHPEVFFSCVGGSFILLGILAGFMGLSQMSSGVVANTSIVYMFASFSLFIVGIQTIILGVIGGIIKYNKITTEDILYRIKKIEKKK
jgi:glycosyltransferase involved in cell wall biosynthesis